MNISINCKLSLSKKLRALLGKEASLTLVSQDIVEGKGTAILTLASDSINDTIKPEDMGETSIMLIPVELAEESPTSQSPVHAAIFSTVAGKNVREPVVQKLAAVQAPERGQVSRAIKEEVETPQAFPELKNPECKTWIGNMEDLVNAVNQAKTKRSAVDVDSAQNDRERLVLQEMKEKEESIDIPAWIVNDKVGMLSVNDLNIALPMNMPFDLSNISAKRVAASRDLRGLLKTGIVKFVSPKEKDQYVIAAIDGTESNHGLEVFDNSDQAMASISSGAANGRTAIIDDRNVMDITESDLSGPTEEEDMILNLTKSAPVTKMRPSTEAPIANRHTVHGNNAPAQDAAPRKPNIKPIRKLE